MKTESQLLEEKVKWHTADSSDGERTLKQHGYISHKRIANYTTDYFDSNKMICGKGGIADENYKFIPLSEIQAEKLDENKCCKKCLKLWKRR